MKNGLYPQKKAALSRQIALRLSCPTSDVVCVLQRENLLRSDEMVKKWSLYDEKRATRRKIKSTITLIMVI